MKLHRKTNRRVFILMCEYCFSPISTGGRYYVDVVTRQVFCTPDCAKKLERELSGMGLPRYELESQVVLP